MKNVFFLQLEKSQHLHMCVMVKWMLVKVSVLLKATKPTHSTQQRTLSDLYKYIVQLFFLEFFYMGAMNIHFFSTCEIWGILVVTKYIDS